MQFAKGAERFLADLRTHHMRDMRALIPSHIPRAPRQCVPSEAQAGYPVIDGGLMSIRGQSNG